MEHNKNLLDNHTINNDSDIDGFKENIQKKHFKLATSGFVWIFMFLFSFGALFVIFKSNDNNYESAKNIVLDSNSTIIAEDNSAVVNSSIKDLLENHNKIQPKVEKPELKLVDIDEIPSNTAVIDKLAEQSTEKVYQNKADTAITQILKNDIAANKPIENKVVESKPIENIKVEEASNTAIVKNNKEEIKATNNNVVANSTVASNTTSNNTKVITGYVVNIYSTNTKDGLNEKLKQIKASNKDVLKNANFYVSQASIDNKTMFRVSVREGNNGYFNTKDEASNFCNRLKAKNINCFISAVETAKLSAHIVK
jgi:hypothetical protein